MWNVSYTACSFVMHKKRKINERCFLYEKCIKNENENKEDEALKKSVQKSFITEHMLINVEIMKNLINDLASSGTADKK